MRRRANRRLLFVGSTVLLGALAIVLAAASYGLTARADGIDSGAAAVAPVPWAVPYQVAGSDGTNVDVLLHEPGRTDPTTIAQSADDEYSPSLSPDGTHIAFVRNEGHNADIFVVGTDGLGLRRITSGPFTDGGPRWSPDSRWIVFWRDDGKGLPEIYIVGSDGKGERQLTSNNFADIHPSWSPDGKTVAFARSLSGSSQTFTFDVASGEETQLTTQDGHVADPSWSPNGEKIVATHSHDGGASWDLVRIRVATGDVETVRENVGALIASVAWKAEGIVVTASAPDLAKFQTFLIDPETADILEELDVPGEPKW